jgi:hypothetical protein
LREILEALEATAGVAEAGTEPSDD